MQLIKLKPKLVISCIKWGPSQCSVHSVPCRAECHYEQEQCWCERLHNVCGFVPLQRMCQTHHPGRWVLPIQTHIYPPVIVAMGGLTLIFEGWESHLLFKHSSSHWSLQTPFNSKYLKYYYHCFPNIDFATKNRYGQISLKTPTLKQFFSCMCFSRWIPHTRIHFKKLKWDFKFGEEICASNDQVCCQPLMFSYPTLVSQQ